MKKLSETSQQIISLLWEKEQPRAVSINIGDTFEIEGKKHKITEDIFNEIIDYQEVAEKPFKLFRGNKRMNLTGK